MQPAYQYDVFQNDVFQTIPVVPSNPAAAASGLIEAPVAAITPILAAFQQNAFQSNAFQMSPVPPSLTQPVYPAAVTIMEVVLV